MAWRRTAAFVNNALNGTIDKAGKVVNVDYTGKSMSTREARNRKKYMDATRASVMTGAGIVEDFAGSNIYQQLQLKIYAYDRLHRLFVGSPHLFPAARITTAYNSIRITTRNKTLNVQQHSAVGERDDQKGEPQNDNDYSESRSLQDDQGDDEELQGSSECYVREAFANYRSHAESTITTSTNSKKRPATPFKGDSGKASDDARRNLPNSLRNPQPPRKSKVPTIDLYIAGKACFALNIFLYYYFVYRIFLSTREFDQILLERSVGIEARIKHEKEMEKERQEFEMKKEQLRMSHENKQLIGKMVIAGFENKVPADELLKMMDAFTKIKETQSDAETSVAPNKGSSTVHLAQDSPLLLAEESTAGLSENPAPHPEEDALDRLD
ncbi:hypothetical protein BKA57DRAFT_119444 [Linnemannia elongata]|nr:hypothetical protein BKA57DRAFT_119444 [Linnemannia elongata]